VGLVDEGDAEGLLHGGDGADEFDGAALGAGGVWRDGEAVLFGEGAYELDGVGIGPVLLTVLRVGEALFACAVGDFERVLAADDDGDGDLRAGWGGFFRCSLDERFFFAAGQNCSR
jgi:hypothetical protein